MRRGDCDYELMVLFAGPIHRLQNSCLSADLITTWPCSRLGEENLQGSVGFVAYLIASFTVAAVIWFCVEQTFLRFRDRLLSPTKK
jgi:hypothetical protein